MGFSAEFPNSILGHLMAMSRARSSESSLDLANDLGVNAACRGAA